jgi:CRISPR-associated protein Csb1
MVLEKEVEELLKDDGPSALVLKETLEPIEGPDAPFCAPTFAPPTREEKKEKSEPLLIGKKEEMWEGGTRNAVIVDTVESQANRLETLLKEKYPELVPQVILRINTKGEPVKINLLDLGHRVADALIRFSKLKEGINKALEEFRKRNHLPLAQISPTSLIFGFWDSRETGIKWPRLLRSEIWAYNVLQLSRKGQYVPAVMKEFKPEEEWKVYTELLGVEAFKKEYDEMGEKEFQDALSSIGLSSIPWPEMTNTFRLADGGRIERIVSLHLVGLRSLSAMNDEEKTNLLQKYILGLSLVLMTCPQDYNLRQGCLLMRKGSPTFEKVYPDGRRFPLNIKHDEALEFTRRAVEELKRKLGISFEKLEVDVDFSEERVEEEIKSAKERKERKAKKEKRKEEE